MGVARAQKSIENLNPTILVDNRISKRPFVRQSRAWSRKQAYSWYRNRRHFALDQRTRRRDKICYMPPVNENASARRLVLSLSMVQVDVFTDRALAGNSLAVFLDGRGLTTEQMQDLAREMNLSETTFILPSDTGLENGCGTRVRIFTVQEELPFAGHPTLGTAFVLRDRSGLRTAPSEVLLDLNVGTVPVRFREESGRPVFGEMTQKNPEFGAIHRVEDIARLTNLSSADFDDCAPIQTVSTGMPFTMVPLRTLNAIGKLRLDLDRAGEYLARSGGKFLYFVCRETVEPRARLHARMIFYNGDDPATGSAAGCCAAWMVAHGIAASEEQVVIEQGLEMHRPSSILVRATQQGSRQDNHVVNVRVGGNCVEVLRGEVTITT
jgi:trans-2,3-dihydro-3-hydroxyanthranilate isomerase